MGETADERKTNEGAGSSESSQVFAGGSDAGVEPVTREEFSVRPESNRAESDPEPRSTIVEGSSQPGNSFEEIRTTPEPIDDGVSVGKSDMPEASSGKKLGEESSATPDTSDGGRPCEAEPKEMAEGPVLGVGLEALPLRRKDQGPAAAAESPSPSENRPPAVAAGLGVQPPRKKGKKPDTAAAESPSPSENRPPSVGAGLGALPPRKKGKKPDAAAAAESPSPSAEPTVGAGLGALPARKKGKGPAKAPQSQSEGIAPTSSTTAPAPQPPDGETNSAKQTEAVEPDEPLYGMPTEEDKA
eukprot:CAMPEP_0118931156 /NCGR_PEP_ID=MMETSP1169-20130426/7592_1 /TAXON_ID=36882 /ORGANISM="Pyramimonas obovata, Strain CCMP722" /LENGTH=299 /DNA_ID=CAMNT_0006873621 /DNA_START=70 /DNA_END=965 /DNA_ORIENTATION=+